MGFKGPFKGSIGVLLGFRRLHKGSWDIVIGVLSKVATVINTYYPNKGTYNLLTKSHDPPSRP